MLLSLAGVLERIFREKVRDFQSRANPEEAELLEKLDPKRLPEHVAVIMDGNGRWAERRHLPRIAGHRAGREGRARGD